MRYLITGGCGFLGSNLSQHAIQHKQQLLIIDNLSRLGSKTNLDWLKQQGDFDFENKDIRDEDDIALLIKDFQPEVIFHLAGQVAMTTSIKDPKADFKINALGTLNVLEGVRQYAPDAAIIYSSTNKVYGDLEQFDYQELDRRYTCLQKPNGFAEDVALEFHSPYGCSKGAADQYVLDYARIYGLKTVVFRHSSMYGGHQYATSDQGWIGWFCQQALLKSLNKLSTPFEISGNGKQVRDILHAEDMKRLYSLAVEKIEIVKGEVFNIGGGIENSLSLLELFELLEKLTGITLDYRNLPTRLSDQKFFVADISKAKKLLNWTPMVGKKQGIAEMYNWLKSMPR